MSLKAILPDGATEVLSYVNRFNFNWMVNYIYADDSAPVLPKGTVIKVTAWYDNTANSPAGGSLCEIPAIHPGMTAGACSTSSNPAGDRGVPCHARK